MALIGGNAPPGTNNLSQIFFHPNLQIGAPLCTSVHLVSAGGVILVNAKTARRPHQPDESRFRSILPEEIQWQSFPAFPPAARLAVMVGHPSEPGPYVVRVKLPGGTKLMPHKHPEDRIYTVMSGVFYIGLGEKFDGDNVKAYPPGSVIVLPGETWHFHWAKSGEYVTQVSAIGPLGLVASPRSRVSATRPRSPNTPKPCIGISASSVPRIFGRSSRWGQW